MNEDIKLKGSFHGDYKIDCSLTDKLYCKFRSAFRECTQVTLRYFFEISDINMRLGNLVNDIEPLIEKSSVGFNPVLDKRIDLELNSKLKSYINKNYIVDDTVIMQAFKCKMPGDILLPSESSNASPFRQHSEFCPADTNYQETKLIMLNKKFEALYQDRISKRETSSDLYKSLKENLDEAGKKKSYDLFEKETSISKQKFG